MIKISGKNSLESLFCMPFNSNFNDMYKVLEKGFSIKIRNDEKVKLSFLKNVVLSYYEFKLNADKFTIDLSQYGDINAYEVDKVLSIINSQSDFINNLMIKNQMLQDLFSAIKDAKQVLVKYAYKPFSYNKDIPYKQYLSITLDYKNITHPRPISIEMYLPYDEKSDSLCESSFSRINFFVYSKEQLKYVLDNFSYKNKIDIRICDNSSLYGYKADYHYDVSLDEVKDEMMNLIKDNEREVSL